MTDAPPLLKITDPAGKIWQITGRAAVLIWLTIIHHERINKVVAGSVEFHLSPEGRVQLELRERMEAVRA